MTGGDNDITERNGGSAEGTVGTSTGPPLEFRLDRVTRLGNAQERRGAM